MDVKKVSYKSFHLQRGNAMHNYDLSPSQRPNPELDGLEPSRFPLLDDELEFFEEKVPYVVEYCGGFSCCDDWRGPPLSPLMASQCKPCSQNSLMRMFRCSSHTINTLEHSFDHTIAGHACQLLPAHTSGLSVGENYVHFCATNHGAVT